MSGDMQDWFVRSESAEFSLVVLSSFPATLLPVLSNETSQVSTLFQTGCEDKTPCCVQPAFANAGSVPTAIPLSDGRPGCCGSGAVLGGCCYYAPHHQPPGRVTSQSCVTRCQRFKAQSVHLNTSWQGRAQAGDARWTTGPVRTVLPAYRARSSHEMTTPTAPQQAKGQSS